MPLRQKGDYAGGTEYHELHFDHLGGTRKLDSRMELQDSGAGGTTGSERYFEVPRRPLLLIPTQIAQLGA
jgi:hypothetical protein